MNKRGISIAAFAIAGVFVATAIAFAICVYSDYNSGLKAAGAKFEKLSSRTAEASEIYPSGSKEFINLFNSAVGAPEIYESINLNINGKDVYVYPMESQRAASVFVKTFSTRIVGGDGADIRLDANIHTVSSSLIYYRAKIAFIIILAGTLLACILLLSQYLGETVQEDGDVEFKKTKVDDEFGESLFDEEAAPEPASDSDPSSASAKTADDAAAPQENAPEEKVDYNPLENAYADQKAQEESGASDAAPTATAGQVQMPGSEQGLFSPASGFGWESYLSTRLESELVRAASSEQDLALALIKVPGMTKEADYYGNVCQALQNFFQFKDFVFECNEDGFAAIMQHSDIDTAMQNAEVLHSELTSALKAAGQDSKPLIGISSRSLRLISAERLKNEAEQALLHAEEDPNSPIIAFRVNPEKYRKFIGGQEENQEE